MADRAALPIRMLNEWVYCPRLFHILYVGQEFLDSVDTVRGRAEHARARGRSRGEGLTEPSWGAEAVREVTFEDEVLGIAGKFDVVAGAADGSLIPVEAKHGSHRDPARGPACVGSHELPAAAWNNDTIQVVAQAMLLRAAGERCDEVRLYYRKTKTTVSFPVEPSLIEAVRWVVEEARKTVAGPIPPPLLDSPKCIGCSMHTVCLPDETNHLLGRQPPPSRSVVPGRLDGGAVYVVSHGARVSKVSASLSIETPHEALREVPVHDIEHLALFGGVHVTPQALGLLLAEGKSVAWHTTSGRLLARAEAVGRPNLEVRRQQYRAADDVAVRLSIGRSLLLSKLRNQRTLLRRNVPAGGDRRAVLGALGEAMNGVAQASTLAELMGFEGQGAKAYFETFGTMFSATKDGTPPFRGRSRRPPRDPVNALLSLGYALLAGDCSSALVRVGLDADLGLLHEPVPGRPALALDLMEPFRPLIVDSIVLRLWNTRSTDESDFVAIGEGVYAKDRAKRVLIEAYEHRVNELVTHAQFNYRMSYRRIFEVESRLLARHLLGELPEWQPLTTR